MRACRVGQNGGFHCAPVLWCTPAPRSSRRGIPSGNRTILQALRSEPFQDGLWPESDLCPSQTSTPATRKGSIRSNMPFQEFPAGTR